MATWLLARLGQALLATWGITSLVFVLSRGAMSAQQQKAFDRLERLEMGGSAGTTGVGWQAAQPPLTADEPLFYVTRTAGPPVVWQWHGLHNQYHTWLSQLLRGNLGQSYGQPVADRLGPALGCTLPLMGLAILFATGLALVLAAYLAAGSPASPGRLVLRLGLTVLQAIPLFTLALVLLLLLANPEVLNILPATDASLDTAASWGGLASYAMRLLLPLLSLILTALPDLTLPLAAALRQELGSTYATAARVKGLTTAQVLWRHALPNALLPLLVVFTGLLPALVAGAVVVEVLFALPGMGRLLAEAAAAHDFPVLIAGVLLTSAVRILALLIVDIVQYRLDPRLRATLA